MSKKSLILKIFKTMLQPNLRWHSVQSFAGSVGKSAESTARSRFFAQFRSFCAVKRCCDFFHNTAAHPFALQQTMQVLRCAPAYFFPLFRRKSTAPQLRPAHRKTAPAPVWGRGPFGPYCSICQPNVPPVDAGICTDRSLLNGQRVIGGPGDRLAGQHLHHTLAGSAAAALHRLFSTAAATCGVRNSPGWA